MKALIEVVELKVMDVITTSQGGGQAGDTCPDYFCEDE